MAKLYVSEFSTLAQTGTGLGQVVSTPPLAEQVLSFSTSVTSVAFQSATKVVRVHTDAICSIAFGGSTIAATTGNMRLAAGQTEYYGVQGGGFIAVISNS